MRPLAIGQAPGQSAAPGAPALCGPKGAGSRLASLLGVPSLRDLVDTVNLLDAFPGRATSGGDRFPPALAREAADKLDLRGRPLLILCGFGVARAFGVPPIPLWMADVQRPGQLGVPALVLPHPSGLNRWYNDPTNRTAATWVLRGLLVERCASCGGELTPGEEVYTHEPTRQRAHLRSPDFRAP